MIASTVIFAPEAQDQLVEIYRYITAASGSPDVALRFTDSIVAYCEGLATFPLRGRLRSDVRPGLRTTNYKRRVLIAYTAESDVISIIGVFYGGQDYESTLSPDV